MQLYSIEGLTYQYGHRNLTCLNILFDVWPVVVESDEEVGLDVGVCRLDGVDDPSGQVKNGVLVRLDRLGGVDDEHERRVERPVGPRAGA